MSKPLVFIGAGVAWLVLAALSGFEISSRRVDGFCGSDGCRSCRQLLRVLGFHGAGEVEECAGFGIL